jgi:hypothetical protein
MSNVELDRMDDLAEELAKDSTYRAAFTARLEAGTINPMLLERLINYARDQQATAGQAIARQVLTAAGISWEEAV